MMKLLLGVILIAVVIFMLPGMIHSLGPMELIWAAVILLAIASMWIPGLRSILFGLVALLVVGFFLKQAITDAGNAYKATKENVRETILLTAAKLWADGKDMLGSLMPSLGGPGDLLDMGAGAQEADEAYAKCLVNAVTTLHQQGRFQDTPYERSQACFPRMPQDSDCVKMVNEYVVESDPSVAQSCVAGNVAGRGQAGFKPLANVLCKDWLPERIRNSACVDRQGKPSDATTSPPVPPPDDARTKCLQSFVATNSLEVSACQPYAGGKDQSRWDQCVVKRTRETFQNRADAILRQCGVSW